MMKRVVCEACEWWVRVPAGEETPSPCPQCGSGVVVFREETQVRELKNWEDPSPGFFRRYFRNLWRALRGEGL